jgi:DNA primase
MNLATRIKQLLIPSKYYFQNGKQDAPRNGAEWATIKCPFHEDNSPSLRINLKSGGFFCHGCGAKGGDIISFEMRKHSLPFKEALKRLSDQWGVI